MAKRSASSKSLESFCDPHQSNQGLSPLPFLLRSWVGLLDEAGGDFYRFNCFDLEVAVCKSSFCPENFKMTLLEATADPRLMQQSPDGRLDHVAGCFQAQPSRTAWGVRSLQVEKKKAMAKAALRRRGSTVTLQAGTGGELIAKYFCNHCNPCFLPDGLRAADKNLSLSQCLQTWQTLAREVSNKMLAQARLVVLRLGVRVHQQHGGVCQSISAVMSYSTSPARDSTVHIWNSE